MKVIPLVRYKNPGGPYGLPSEPFAATRKFVADGLRRAKFHGLLVREAAGRYLVIGQIDQIVITRQQIGKMAGHRTGVIAETD